MLADDSVTAPGGGDLEDEAGEWFGEHDGLAPRRRAHVIAAGLDVAEGEAADRRGLLGVEQDEQPGDAVVGFERVIVQQPACLFPAGLGVDGAGRAVLSDGHEVQPGQLVLS